MFYQELLKGYQREFLQNAFYFALGTLEVYVGFEGPQRVHGETWMF